jgi:hydroxyacylglutathione hydrolase
VELIKENIFLIKNKMIFSSNTYIYKFKLNNECIIVDPGFDTELIDTGIKQNNLIPIAIISTHGHFDHIGSAAFFKNKYLIPFYLHEGDLKIAQSANFFLKIAGINHKIEIPKPDKLLKGKTEKVILNNFELSVFNFPGHSSGSCIIKHENNLFTGDIIYKNGLGFNHLPGEDKNKIKQSILEIFDIFPIDCLVLPGHGHCESLINIKNNNSDLIKFLN